MVVECLAFKNYWVLSSDYSMTKPKEIWQLYKKPLKAFDQYYSLEIFILNNLQTAVWPEAAAK